MANAVAVKSLKCFQWRVLTTENYSSYVSKSFSLQDHTYYLELSTGSTSVLNFRSVENPSSLVNTTVRVRNQSRIINVQAQTITSNTRISYTSGGFLNKLLTFEVMIHDVDPSKGEFSFFFLFKQLYVY